jgi:hypothetical protein
MSEGQRKELEQELVEVYQDLRCEAGQWVCKVGVRLAGRVREGLGWGKTPEEAKRKAVQEALSLAPEGRGLLEAIEKTLTPPQEEGEGKEKGKEASSETPSSPTPVSSPEGASPKPPKDEAKTPPQNPPRSPFSVGEAMGRVVRVLKERFPEAYYLALEEIGMGEKDVKTLISLIEKGEEDEATLEKARKVYGTFREIYKSLASREEKPPRKELVLLVRKIVESRFGEKS